MYRNWYYEWQALPVKIINLQTHMKVHYALKECFYNGEVNSQWFNWHELAVQRRKQRICIENKRDRVWFKEIQRTAVPHRKQGSLTLQLCGCAGTWDACTPSGNKQVSLQKDVPPTTHFSSKSNCAAEPKLQFLPDLVHWGKNHEGLVMHIFLEGLSRKVDFIHWIFLHNCKVFKLIP